MTLKCDLAAIKPDDLLSVILVLSFELPTESRNKNIPPPQIKHRLYWNGHQHPWQGIHLIAEQPWVRTNNYTYKEANKNLFSIHLMIQKHIQSKTTIRPPPHYVVLRWYWILSWQFAQWKPLTLGYTCRKSSYVCYHSCLWCSVQQKFCHHTCPTRLVWHVIWCSNCVTTHVHEISLSSDAVTVSHVQHD